MKKLIVAGVIAIMTIGTAYAGPRHGYTGGSGYRGGAYYGGGYRGAYPRYGHGYGYRNNYAPWVAGAMGLGILGAAAAGTYYYNNPVCYRRVVGYDGWGNPIVRRYCE